LFLEPAHAFFDLGGVPVIREPRRRLVFILGEKCVPRHLPTPSNFQWLSVVKQVDSRARRARFFLSHSI
jgi:hypothetical protein